MLASASATLLALLTGATPAQAFGNEFDSSYSSGRPGFSTVISQIDPCPTVSGDQYLDVTFTAANSATINNTETTAANGDWDSFHLAIPLNAANGNGTITAYCRLYSNNSITKTYNSKTYTVLGSSAKYNIPRTNYGHGETLYVRPAENCPEEWNSVANATLFELATTESTYVEANNDFEGGWGISYVIPDTLPVGTYRLDVVCYASRAVEYQPMEIEVVAAPTYVALGDSFSSGESAGSYVARSGGCHRSTVAYAYQVATGQSTGTPTMMACSGALTADIATANPDRPAEPAQDTALQDATELVTLTVGGNDAGFKQVLDACSYQPSGNGFGCQYDYPMVSALYARMGALGGSGTEQAPEDDRDIVALSDLYISIANKAPNAKVFVGGYPRLFGPNVGDYQSNGAAPSGYGCVLTPGAVVDYDDAQWLNQVADDLNTTIQAAVTAAQTAGKSVYYVSPSLFTTHRQCDSGAEWINGVFLSSGFPITPTQESLHPNADGQHYGYGDAFNSTINFYS